MRFTFTAFVAIAAISTLTTDAFKLDEDLSSDLAETNAYP
jgi:hypothetical protein